MISNLFNKILNNVWPMLVVFIVAITLLRYFYLQNHKEKICFHKEVKYLVSIIYIWLLFEILTMAELNSAGGMNLVPFSEILRYKVGTKMFNYNVLGNVIIFIPFGYIVSQYVNPKKIWPVIITTLLTSGIVEFVQLKIGRSFDIDDIILNFIGGVLGYLLYVIIKAIKKKLPDFLQSDTIYNIIWIALIVLFGMYLLGYWGVFNV